VMGSLGLAISKRCLLSRLIARFDARSAQLSSRFRCRAILARKRGSSAPHSSTRH
jgi:collagenase-like PrtC family protease